MQTLKMVNDMMPYDVTVLSIHVFSQLRCKFCVKFSSVCLAQFIQHLFWLSDDVITGESICLKTSKTSRSRNLVISLIFKADFLQFIIFLLSLSNSSSYPYPIFQTFLILLDQNNLAFDVRRKNREKENCYAEK